MSNGVVQIGVRSGPAFGWKGAVRGEQGTHEMPERPLSHP